MYEFTNRAENVRRKLIKLQREIDESSIMVGDCNSPLSGRGQIQHAENQ